jgi:hypothetical protein
MTSVAPSPPPPLVRLEISKDWPTDAHTSILDYQTRLRERRVWEKQTVK